jgi:hypothetical protein
MLGYALSLVSEFLRLSYKYAYASTISDIHLGAGFGSVPCLPARTHRSARARAAATQAWQK